VRTLSASDSTLVIQAPTWIGVALVILGIALVAAAFIRKPKRPWRLGACLATLVLLYMGWYLLNTSATFESRGFIVDGMLGEEERQPWSRVSGVDTGVPFGSKNADPVHLIIQLRNSTEVAIDTTGLDAADKARVVAFIKSKLTR